MSNRLATFRCTRAGCGHFKDLHEGRCLIGHVYTMIAVPCQCPEFQQDADPFA